MSSDSFHESHSTNMRETARTLRVPTLPWWSVLAMDAILGAAACVLVQRGLVKVERIPWQTAGVLGVAISELLAAIAGLILVLKWRSKVRDSRNSWTKSAYDHFNRYLSDSHSPLDNNNVREAATLVGDIVEHQGWNSHVWHAAVGMLLTVPVCVSTLQIATQKLGDPRERFSEYVTPLGVVLGVATATLVVSLLGMLARRSGIAAWKVHVCDLRATDLVRRVADAAPAESFAPSVASPIEAASRAGQKESAQTDGDSMDDYSDSDDYGSSDPDHNPDSEDRWNTGKTPATQASAPHGAAAEFGEGTAPVRTESPSHDESAESDSDGYYHFDPPTTESNSPPKRRRRDSSQWDT